MKLATSLAIGIAALILGSAAMLLANANVWALGPSDGAAIRFTILQAGLSSVISTCLAIPLARALFRRRFWGREALIMILSAPFVLPVLAAVLGLLSIFGRNGPINGFLSLLDLPSISIFGLHGVVMANVFFNLPLATRVLLQGWQAIPTERFFLARSLDLPPVALFRHLELPMLRSQVTGILAAIFLICLTSFAIALTLGGGPRASTIELSIYQALRFEFDLGRAAVLAFVQFGLCAGVTILALRFSVDSGLGLGLRRSGGLIAPKAWGIDAVVIFLAALFLISPMAAALMRGIGGLDQMPASTWPALARSVMVAVLATGLSVTCALILALGRGPWPAFGAMLPFATSGLVLGTGLFLILRPYTNEIALPMAVLVNALMSLPFLYRILAPETARLETDYGRLSASLDLPRITWFRYVALPRLARPLGYGAGLAAALSMGELGVIALFGDDQTATLPLLVQRLMSAYRMDAAAAGALVLVFVSAGMFFALDAWGRRYAAT
jgi:thiamine transport system permease protein